MAKATSRKTQKAVAGNTRIFLVDDHPVIRRGLAQMLSQKGQFTIAGEADGVCDALAGLQKNEVDLVIVDITLADGSGLELIKDLHTMRPETKILVASMHHDAMYAQRAIRAGAQGYLCKEQPPDQIIDAVQSVLMGHIYICPDLASTVLQRALQPDDKQTDDPIQALSDRELEVFELLGDGLASREIAERLSLSIKTIDTYRDHIKTKLNFDSSNEVTHHAIRWKLEREKG